MPRLSKPPVKTGQDRVTQGNAGVHINLCVMYSPLEKAILSGKILNNTGIELKNCTNLKYSV